MHNIYCYPARTYTSVSVIVILRTKSPNLEIVCRCLSKFESWLNNHEQQNTGVTVLGINDTDQNGKKNEPANFGFLPHLSINVCACTHIIHTIPHGVVCASS